MRVIISIFLLSLFFNLPVEAQKSDLGIGVIFGEPTGISAKYWITESNAVDFALAYSFVGVRTGLSLHADYLYHINDLIKSEYNIPFYYGFGVRLRTNNHHSDSFGVRGVAGLLLFLKDYPIDVFIEAAPIFNLFPETYLNLDLAIGARYYFQL